MNDSAFVCYTPSLTKTSSHSGRDVSRVCGSKMKYHNLTNELAVRIPQLSRAHIFSSHSIFPVIDKVGNVDNFVQLITSFYCTFGSPINCTDTMLFWSLTPPTMPHLIKFIG